MSNAATSAIIPAIDAPRLLTLNPFSPAICHATSEFEQPRRVVDQYLVLQFGLRREQAE